MRIAAVLLAAGTGSRAGTKIPKQFLPLAGEPLFMSSVRAFAKTRGMQEIVLVGRAADKDRLLRLVRTVSTKIQFTFARGGAYRGASVCNGVSNISKIADVVLVHDAARPLVTPEIIGRVANAAQKFGAALAAWPLADTLKRASVSGHVRKTIPRRNLWLAQTPQGFRWEAAQACLLKPSPTATDDAELAERRGYKVHVVEGAATNFKVTYPMDLDICRLLKKHH